MEKFKEGDRVSIDEGKDQGIVVGRSDSGCYLVKCDKTGQHNASGRDLAWGSKETLNNDGYFFDESSLTLIEWQPKQGERVLVSYDGKGYIQERKFVVFHNNRYYCESDAYDKLYPWNFCKPHRGQQTQRA